MTRQELERSLIAFVEGPLSARRAATSPRVRVENTTRLFETGIVDSLGIIDLLAFVERATGARIPPRKVDMKYFATIDRICSSFCPGEEPS